MKKLRVLFFWTPQLSADILTFLLTQEEIEIIWVVSTPDKVGGRGHEIIKSPVTQLAQEKDLPLFQPEKLRNNEAFTSTLASLNPDVCIVVAYGKIIPENLLAIPPMGFLNVHTSLLPKYRGAAPIQHALMDGETQTGLTIMQMDANMDTGDILLQETWDITDTDTTGWLWEKTGERAGPLLMQTLRGLSDGSITPEKQDENKATYTKYIEKQDGEIQSTWTVDEAYHRWQAYTPWPSLFILENGVKFSLLKIKRMKNEEPCLPAGRWRMKNEGLFIVDKLPAIQLADWIILIEKIHPAGKKPMSGEEFVRGYMTLK